MATIEDAGAAKPTDIQVRIIAGRPFVSDFPFRLKSGAAWPSAPVLAFNGPSGTIQWPSTLSDGGKLATVKATKAEVDTLLGPNRQSGSVELNDVPTGRMWAHGRYFSLPSNWQGGTNPTALADGAVIVDDRLVIMGTGDGSGTVTSIAWGSVTGKPSSYPPSTHSHTATDLSGVVKTVNGTVPDGSGNVTVPTGSGAPPDATTSQKGIVRLAGDLAGTAGNPTVPGLAGKADSDHTHAAADIGSGTLAIARIPTGTTSSTVALGNHTHSGYATSTHNHDSTYVKPADVQATPQAINAQTGTTYTLQASDAGKLVTLTNGSAITLTVPGGVFTAGQRVDCSQRGAGAVTVVGSGVTLRPMPGMTLVSEGQYAAWSVYFHSATEADVIGWMAPA